MSVAGSSICEYTDGSVCTSLYFRTASVLLMTIVQPELSAFSGNEEEHADDLIFDQCSGAASSSDERYDFG